MVYCVERICCVCAVVFEKSFAFIFLAFNIELEIVPVIFGLPRKDRGRILSCVIGVIIDIRTIVFFHQKDGNRRSGYSGLRVEVFYKCKRARRAVVE